MKAAIFDEFRQPPTLRKVIDPVGVSEGLVLKVNACGICRSDWLGWMGYDADIKPPHVPGHELSGTVEEVGKGVILWKRGDRITLPFVCGCGKCPQCASGNQQICYFQSQPGFTTGERLPNMSRLITQTRISSGCPTKLIL